MHHTCTNPMGLNRSAQLYKIVAAANKRVEAAGATTTAAATSKGD